MSNVHIKDGSGLNKYLSGGGLGTDLDPYVIRHNVSKNELGYDAWGVQKSRADKSLLSYLFTYDVPKKLWKEMNWNGSDFIEQSSFTKATSVEGSLHFTSGTVLNDKTQLRSKRHGRYQPNRGHLYSSSLFLPNPTGAGIRRFGLVLPCNGVFFELEGDGTNYTFSFVIRNHFVDTKYDITSNLPAGIDLTKGNLFDFQMQWRGVGDYKIFVNHELIFSTSELGTRTKVSVENPSLPAGFEIQNLGDEVKMIVGCIDITSEGGEMPIGEYSSFSTGENALLNVSSSGTAVLAIRMPYKLTYGGNEVCYSRDAFLTRISTFSKDEAFRTMYMARGINVPNLKNLTWVKESDGFVEYTVGGTSSSLYSAFQLDKANMDLVTSERQEKDFLVYRDNPDALHSPLVITADTYIVIELKPDANNKGGCTIEISEQI